MQVHKTFLSQRPDEEKIEDSTKWKENDSQVYKTSVQNIALSY